MVRVCVHCFISGVCVCTVLLVVRVCVHCFISGACVCALFY